MLSSIDRCVLKTLLTAYNLPSTLTFEEAFDKAEEQSSLVETLDTKSPEFKIHKQRMLDYRAIASLINKREM